MYIHVDKEPPSPGGGGGGGRVGTLSNSLGGGGEWVHSQILKKIYQNIFSLKKMMPNS